MWKLSTRDLLQLRGQGGERFNDFVTRNVAAAISLFPKVGFSGEVAVDLDALCVATGLSKSQFQNAVNSIRSAPGFVVQAGRFWYVTPEIVARVLFAVGYQLWIATDPLKFLRSIPAHMAQGLLERAGTHAEKGARDELSQCFRKAFAQLNSADLANTETISLVCAILETSPKEFLPQLRSIIEYASPDEILAIRGDSIGGEWGPSRTLVWLFERLVSFPEYFEDCEACLFVLAVNETEPNLGNNATEIWANLFSIYLSGTAKPFPERISVLRGRTSSGSQRELTVGYMGVDKAFQLPIGTIVGRPIVGGQLRPADWTPSTQHELLQCYEQVLDICRTQIVGNDPLRRPLAFDCVVRSIDFLLDQGVFAELQRVFDSLELTPSESRRLVFALDEFLEQRIQVNDFALEKVRKKNVNELETTDIRKVTDWISKYRPTDFDGLLRSICLRDPWDRRFEKGQGQSSNELSDIAKRIVESPKLLTPNLGWLGSDEARSAELLGYEVGRADRALVCASMIFDHAIRTSAVALMRGYVRGLSENVLTVPKELARLIENLESSAPILAVEILLLMGEKCDGMRRILSLARSQVVPVRSLVSFANQYGRRELTAEEVRDVLEVFAERIGSGDTDSCIAGIRFLSLCLLSDARIKLRDSLSDPVSREYAWKIVEALHTQAKHARIWRDLDSIMKRLRTSAPERAIHFASVGLLSEDLDAEKFALKQLEELASGHPITVMSAFGLSLLDESRGWHLQVHVCRVLVERLPQSVVLDWVRNHGLRAARAIARHLPVPFIDQSGSATVPDVLDVVLKEFDDDNVLTNFIAGSHSGEVWNGNASKRLRKDAEDAMRFLDHSNRRIREWAKHEVTSRMQFANWEDQEEAEQFLPN